MRKFLVICAALFLAMPVNAARVCMLDNSIATTSQAELAALSATTQTELAALDARIAALENPSDDTWISAWIDASGTLNNSTINYNNSQNGTWSVAANQDGTGSQKASGVSMCSNTSSSSYGSKGAPSTTNGLYCWCKMDTPRVGAWVFYASYSSASNCAPHCAYVCANNVLANTDFRSAVLALP